MRNFLLLISFLIILFGFATLQTATAQQKHDEQKHYVTINVEKINSINPPGDLTITVKPSIGDFTGTGKPANGYDVATNAKKDQKIQVEATNISAKNGAEETDLVSLDIDGSDTAAPGKAEAKDADLVTDGDLNGVKDLTTGFSGVNSQYNDVEYEAEVSPDFSPKNGNIIVKVKYTLTEN